MEVTPEMAAAVEVLGDDLRQVGLYVDESHFIAEHGERYLLVVALVGDVAFSDRVQNPEKADTDRKVAEMDLDLARGGLDEAKDRIRRRLAEGRSPLGED